MIVIIEIIWIFIERLINIWVMQQNLKVKEYRVQMTGISILTRVKNKFFRKN